MELTLYLASVIGLYFITIGLALLLNEKHVNSAIEVFAKYPGLFFICGLFILLLGLLLVVGHNRWYGGVYTIVTAIGWLTLLKGLFWILLPDKIIKAFIKIKDDKNIFFVGGVICLTLGIYLGTVGLGGV